MAANSFDTLAVPGRVAQKRSGRKAPKVDNLFAGADGAFGFSSQLNSHKVAFRQRGRHPMRDDGGQAIFFYSRHPITAEIILSKLRASRGNLDGLRPEDLYPHDQDHYGGVEANDVLAAAAGIGDGARVADFCAGLGGPKRVCRRHGVRHAGACESLGGAAGPEGNSARRLRSRVRSSSKASGSPDTDRSEPGRSSAGPRPQITAANSFDTRTVPARVAQKRGVRRSRVRGNRSSEPPPREGQEDAVRFLRRTDSSGA